MDIIANTAPPASFARSQTSTRQPLRVGMIQHHWRENAAELTSVLTGAIGKAADAGARAIFLPELTLSKYPANIRADSNPARNAEDLLNGPTFEFAANAARKHCVTVHASLYERSDGTDGLGFNTAILVSAQGELLARFFGHK